MSSDEVFYEAVEKVIEEMALLIEKLIKLKTVRQNTKSTPPDSSRSSSSTVQQSRMVGADDALLQMKDKLTNNCGDRQIIPIVGMGGSGKTTLARNIYQDPLILERFDIRAWITISQEYSIREILEQLLKQLDKQFSHDLDEGKLGEMLHKHLYGRKYLIILDDMWSIRAWDGVGMYLPNNINGSRIVITTRLSNLASKLTNSNRLEVKLLDEADSWDLLSKTVFGEEGCPFDLKEIGKKIGKSCKGLPLSIVVVGGFLAKSKHTREFWEYIEENINEIVNLEDNEHCLKILYMSYKQLPVYLKPCFLYMGVFLEDEVIRVSRLIKLWAAEGFIKPISGKTLEEIAKEYLDDLIGRNLIMIHAFAGSTGNIKECKIHDLLRDLSLREAEKERFYTPNHQRIVSGQRRIVISRATSKNVARDTWRSMSQARSLMWHLDDDERPALLNFRLLRILEVCATGNIGLDDEDIKEFLENVQQLLNSRFLCFKVSLRSILPSSICLSWNLQTLIVHMSAEDTRINIWNMPHIRHIQVINRFCVPDLPNGQDDNIVLGNLQRLGKVRDFKCCELMVKKIPNIKKLVLDYKHLDVDEYCLSNLDCLNKLESLTCYCNYRVINGSLINFPHSLNKLNLNIDFDQYWEDLLDKIGSLPVLEKLILETGKFREWQWETTEGQFCSLKFLALKFFDGLSRWTTESSHFPCLEHLLLHEALYLEEIPLDFAEISTLRVIEVVKCGRSVVVSSKRILEAQEELYGEEEALQVQVTLEKKNEDQESLASSNFRVHM